MQDKTYKKCEDKFVADWEIIDLREGSSNYTCFTIAKKVSVKIYDRIYTFFTITKWYMDWKEEHMDDKERGKRIQQLRQEMNLSQEQLVEKLNVSQNTIAKIECGLRRPSIDFTIELAEFFETSVQYIWLGVPAEHIDKKREIEEASDLIDQMVERLQGKQEELLQMKKELE